MFNDPAAAPPRLGDRILDWLDRLGKARDGMIVALVGVYILGFLSWASYSYREHIGFIQIFNTQYLIGGILPFISIMVAPLAWWLWQKIPAPVRRLAAILAYIVSFLAVGILIRPAQLEPVNWGKGFQLLQAMDWWWAVFAFSIGLLSTSVLLIGVRQAISGQPIERLLPRFIDRYWSQQEQQAIYSRNRPIVIVVGSLLSAALILVTLIFYFTVIYPGMPQELGGPRPRCADVVVDEDKLPAKLLQSLGVEAAHPTFYRGALDSVRGLFGKKPEKKTIIPHAQVLYNDDKAIIFKPAAAVKAPTLVELRKDAVGTLVWCSN